MIRLPLNENWTQANTSDRVGSLAWTKNINLDKKGYMKLSPRTVNIFDDAENLPNSADTDFNIPTAFGRTSNGDFYLATTDEPFNISLGSTSVFKTIAEDSALNNPNLNFMSHGVWWQNRFHMSTDTTVSYKTTAGTWTANAITGLTSGVRHYMAVFASRVQLCVSNGNVVKQYSESGGTYTNTTDLTIPSDYEITGLAYNNSRMAVITRLGSDTSGQNTEARFYIWDGASTGASSDAGVGADSILAVRPYKTSFVIITSAGQLLYWNGGGFDELASFPFYFDDFRSSGQLTNACYGDSIIVDGDTILINIGFNLNGISVKSENYLPSNPSGIWCYDPEIGLYHKFSPSLSRAYRHLITPAGNVDTSTNIFTTSSTIPETGNIAVMPTATVGGLNVNQIYYIIKLSSTTFKLAETKEDAVNGVAVDITSASENNFIWMYDIKDYGISHYTTSGAISLMGGTSPVYRDLIFGNRLLDTDMSSIVVLNMCVPFLENRGYGVTPRLFLNSTTENVQSLTIKHAPLANNDKIIVKIKEKDIYGLPTSTPDNNSNSITWTSSKGGYTSMNLSEAKTAFDAGEQLEIELTAGVGSGQLIKITNISESEGVYALEFEDDVIGYTSLGKSYFVVDNWKYLSEVDAETQREGVFDVPVAITGKSLQFKVELRGYGTTIEDVFINNYEHIK